MPAKQSRFWVFTLNNYTEDDVVVLHGAAEDEGVSYLCFGYEVGGEAGTPHLQGYIEFKKSKRLTGVKRILGSRYHLESRMGTALEASEYCKKDGDFEEFGNISQPEQGKRSDLDAIQERIAGGTTPMEIADTDFSQWVYHRRAFEEYHSMKFPAPMRRDLKVYVLWGPAGSGKSSYVYSRHPEVYSCPSTNLQWFNGYNGHLCVLIDDFEGQADVGFLKKFLDIYPLQVPTKGGFRNFHADTIFITSNHPAPWGYIHDEGPIMRRVRQFEVVKGEGESIEDVHVRIDAFINS